MPTTTNALGKRVLERYKADPPTIAWALAVTAHAPAGWISDRDFGLAIIVAYGRGDATSGDVDAALAAGWITQEEYDAVFPPEEPPEEPEEPAQAQAPKGAAQAKVTKKSTAKK